MACAESPTSAAVRPPGASRGWLVVVVPAPSALRQLDDRREMREAVPTRPPRRPDPGRALVSRLGQKGDVEHAGPTGGTARASRPARASSSRARGSTGSPRELSGRGISTRHTPRSTSCVLGESPSELRTATRHHRRRSPGRPPGRLPSAATSAPTGSAPTARESVTISTPAARPPTASSECSFGG